MSLKEEKIIDKIEILEDNRIQVREANIIKKNDQEISRLFYRFILNPGDDLTNQDSKVISIANALWTEEIINSFKKSRS